SPRRPSSSCEGFLMAVAPWNVPDEREWSWAIADWSQVKAKMRGFETGPSPVDRGRPGSKRHLLVDGTGIPLAFTVTGGNRNEITQLIPLLDAVPTVHGVFTASRRWTRVRLGIARVDRV